MNQHFAPVPGEIAESLRSAETRRLVLSLNGHRYRRVWRDLKALGPCIIISKPMMREIGVEQGDIVEVELMIDPYPDQVDICEELHVALEQDPDAAKRFYSITPGRRRSLAHYVDSAKRVETRIKRSLDLAHKLRTYTLDSDE